MSVGILGVYTENNYMLDLLKNIVHNFCIRLKYISHGILSSYLKIFCWQSLNILVSQ